MIKRICHKCGTTWYSADTSDNVWTCQKCGAEIPKEEIDLLDETIAHEFSEAGRTLKGKPIIGKSKYFDIPVIQAGKKSAREMLNDETIKHEYKKIS